MRQILRSVRRVVCIGVLIALALIGMSGVAAGDGTSSEEPVPGADTLVIDGDFEAPGLAEAGSYLTYLAQDQPGLGGWTITAGSVDVVGPGSAIAASGEQFLDLNGNGGVGSGSITQDLPAERGRTYRLTFMLAGNPNGDPPVKTMDVTLGSVTTSFRFDVGEHSSDALGWTAFSMTAQVCGGGTVPLTFTSSVEGERGPLIDAISVVDVGSASCSQVWWQVAALGVLGAGWVVAVVLFARAVFDRAERRRSSVVSPA